MRVVQVWAGPRRSSAAKAVTSFITEAGFIAALALIASVGAGWSTDWLQAATASTGMRALSSARRTPGGRALLSAWAGATSNRPVMKITQRERFFMSMSGILIERLSARR